MSSVKNEYERLFKLWATVTKLILDGKRDIKLVAGRLQSIVDGERQLFELYLSPAQSSGGTDGYDLLRHLTQSGFINRCHSLTSIVIAYWEAYPSTYYPLEFRQSTVYLWKYVDDSIYRGGAEVRPCVPCLVWENNKLTRKQTKLLDLFGADQPALIDKAI